MEHGGDLLSYESYYNGDLIDFSSNINPLGTPKGLDGEIIKGYTNLFKYPDIKYRHLKTSIGKYLKCNIENTIVGNGAMDIIDNFTIIFPRIIIFSPSFSEYKNRALVHGKEVIDLNYNEDFTIDLNTLERTIKPNDLLILGNPNNPTGLRIDKGLLMEVYKIIIEKKGYLLLDEAFYEFAPKDYDSIEIFREFSFENIGIIRAATKFFALPGIRLGYACVSENIAKEYENIAMPWSVNAFADIAGQFIFKDIEYIEESKKYIDRERQYLLNELGKIEGIKVFNTHTNYILIKLLQWNEEYVFKFFLKRGLIIRKCSSFKLDDYIRIAIKDRENNKRLVKVFEELEASQ
ncbi:MAG: aminotransferase class I/II-fold pyridoxal phosphate-dependent enzyme [Tissierellia bacterium]|nr:aminotransferase class I/II-fold pyridoxal phosphate-dependent enzyme [Tissierellia bacterium]